MAEERSCTQLADELGSTPQRVYYHVRMHEIGGRWRPVQTVEPVSA